MKKNLFLYLFFSLAISFCFSTEYYVGNDLSDFCLIQVNENDALVVYEQDNSIKGLLKTETQLREILIPFTEEISNIQGLKTINFSVPIICFLGNYGENFGFFLLEFINNNFSEVKFIPIINKYDDKIETIQNINHSNWINYSFILEGHLYCIQWNLEKDTIEKVYSFDIKETIVEYDILMENSNLYGYAKTIKDEIYLFSCIENNMFIENYGKVLENNTSLFMSLLGDIYCIYTSDIEKSVMKYNDKKFNKIISLDTTEDLPLIVFDNIDITKKLNITENQVSINDIWKTNIEYDFVKIIPTGNTVFLLIKNNQGWMIYETDFNETKEYIIDIKETCEFLQYYIKDNYCLVFYDSTKEQLILYDLFGREIKNFYSLEEYEGEFLKKEETILFLLNVKIDNFDLVLLDNGKAFKTDSYLLIKYTTKRNNKYYYALYTENGYIKIEEFIE